MSLLLTLARAALVAATLLAPGAADAATEKRIALVIGNASYAESPLRNPANDARAMADALKGRGFDVILRVNATKSQMENAVADFGEKLTEGATGIFFYAGHGMQVNGRNFLIPVDAKITSEQRVRLETLDVDVVLDQMSAAKARVSMVILDACRNNPFERRFRSAGGGLAQINAPEGTLLAYATAPGKVAADGEGANGLYTAELLRALASPGLKVEDVFKRVRINVSRATNGGQIPWEASSLTGDFFFTDAAASPAPAGASSSTAEIAFWESIKASTDATEYRAYLEQFPSGTFAPLARARVAALAPQSAVRQPAPAPATATAPSPASAAPAPVPVAAAPVAPAAPQVASLPPASRAAEFSVAISPGVLLGAGGSIDALFEDGMLTLVGAIQGIRAPESCYGQGKVAADGKIAPFDLRCVGGGTPTYLAIAGRIADEGGRAVLLLSWRNATARTGEIRAVAR